MSNVISAVIPSIRTLPLPDHDSRRLFSRAVELFRRSPTDFAAVGEWLDTYYSEATLRSQCQQRYRSEFAGRLRQKRLDGTGNFALSSYKRRLAIQMGRPREELMRDTIHESRLRGYRLEGILLLPDQKSFPIDYADDTVASERSLMVRWRYVAKQHPDRIGQPIDEGNYEVVWRCDDKRYQRQVRQIIAERRAAEMFEYDHPEDAGWRIERAISEIIAAEYPDGSAEHVEHSRRVVAVAALLVWPEPLPMLGELGRWEWYSKADSSTEPTGDAITDMLREEAQRLERGPHKRRPGLLHPRTIGREEVLFHRSGESRQLWNHWGDLSQFLQLLGVAVDELDAVNSGENGVSLQALIVAPQLMGALRAPATSAGVAEDSASPIRLGPVEPLFIVGKSKRVEVQSVVYKVVVALWDAGSLKVDNFVEAVWGHDEQRSGSAVRTAINRANLALLETNLGQIHQKGGFVQLTREV